MDKISLKQSELDSIKCGEAITFTTVMTILIISIVAVVVYKLFYSSDGTVQLPGGYKFQWK